MPSSFPTLPSPSRMSRLLSPTRPNPSIIPFLSCLTDAHYKLCAVLTLAQTLYNHSWSKLQDLGAARSAKSTNGSFFIINYVLLYCCKWKYCAKFSPGHWLVPQHSFLSPTLVPGVGVDSIQTWSLLVSHNSLMSLVLVVKWKGARKPLIVTGKKSGEEKTRWEGVGASLNIHIKGFLSWCL